MRKILLVFLSVIITLVACEKKIPINELTKAKDAIALAKSVDAEKYSPEELKAADEALIKAHELIIKDEKLEDSVKSAELAYTKAMEAYNRSAVLYAGDALKKADDAIAEADLLYAEKLSPENFTQAKDFYNSANEKFESKDYVMSHSLAEEAYKKALKAKEESLDNKYQLQSKIEEVNLILSRVEKYDYMEYAPERYNMAKDKVELAAQDYNSNNLKSGFENVEIARSNAEEAYNLTLSGEATAKLSVAAEAVDEASSCDGATYAADDLAAAKEALANAKKLKESGNYEESIRYSSEAIKLSNEVITEGGKAAIAAKVKAEQEKNLAAKSSEKDKTTVDDSTSKTEEVKKKKVSSKGGVVDEDENYYYYKVKTWEKYQECLSRIAEEFYKNAKLWTIIHKANSDKIKNPDLIQPGWIIKVPKRK
mgnify:FL=1